jgi:competence protein ComFC
MFRGWFDCNYCLICHDRIESTLGWVDLFVPEQKEVVCYECLTKLERIEGVRCQICMRSFLKLDAYYQKGELCFDCYRWEEEPNYKGILKQNYSLYSYNQFLKELIAKYKYRGDYVLAKIFASEIEKKIKEMKPNYIIPIPLSEERMYERGFNQAEALILEAGLQSTNILTRIHSEKQSKKSRTERIHLPQVFHTTAQVTGKIIIIDDIYTTGSTLRHAARVLKNIGADEIFSITIARG